MACASRYSVESGQAFGRLDSFWGFRSTDAQDGVSMRVGLPSAALPSISLAKAQRRQKGRPVRMISAPLREPIPRSGVARTFPCARAAQQELRPPGRVPALMACPSRDASGDQRNAAFAVSSVSHPSESTAPDVGYEFARTTRRTERRDRHVSESRIVRIQGGLAWRRTFWTSPTLG